MVSYLLDTCAVIWIANNQPLREPANSELSSTYDQGLYVSPMTAWEMAQLIAKGRLALSIDPQIWFKRLFESPDIFQAQLTTSVLISSTTIPNLPITDPVDRILIATARAYGFTLVTRDQEILKYGQTGHVKVLGC